MAGSCSEDGGFEDAYQDGTAAFLEAVRRYDPEKNHLFRAISGAVWIFISGNGGRAALTGR